MRFIDIGAILQNTLTSTRPFQDLFEKRKISKTNIRRITIGLIVGLSLMIRIIALNTLGFNSDEAVYVGQAAAIAEDPALAPIFPIFRAHPLLYQFVLAVVLQFGVSDFLARFISTLVGVLTVFIVFLLGELLYGRWGGIFSALFIALMPYHVVVSRQILLDGPFTLLATLTFYLLARFIVSRRPIWLYACGASMGLTFLSKETGVIFLGSIYIFLSLVPRVRIAIKDLVFSLAFMILTIAPYPITSLFARGASERTQQYLIWQFFRSSNHEWNFYLINIPTMMGLLLIAAALFGLISSIRKWGWRETLLLSWILVPLIFFQMWPTKGFQYLLPLAPAVAILGARSISNLLNYEGQILPNQSRFINFSGIILSFLISLTLFVSSWQRIFPNLSTNFLAGSGGVPGGREAGLWIRENVPENATLMTIGPSMANILMFYGHRQALGLSVSPNPLNRNPSYDPILNPDYQIRTGEIRFLVWDSFSAGRSIFFSDKLLHYVQKYNGRVVYTKAIKSLNAEKQVNYQTAIVIYEVHP